jgi:hypothetical protein
LAGDLAVVPLVGTVSDSKYLSFAKQFANFKFEIQLLPSIHMCSFEPEAFSSEREFNKSNRVGESQSGFLSGSTL